MQASGVRFGLVVRVYNDGVAIRYILPEGAKHIGNERTAWALPQRVKKVAWAEYEPGYEGYVHVTALEAMPDKGYVGGPLTVDLGNCYVTLTEADCESFPDMAFTRSGNTFQAGFPASEKDGISGACPMSRKRFWPEGIREGCFSLEVCDNSRGFDSFGQLGYVDELVPFSGRRA